MKLPSTLTSTLAALFLLNTMSHGVITFTTHRDAPSCDFLAVPEVVEELGWGPALGGPFPGDGMPGGPPSDEEITSFTQQATNQPACVALDNTGIPNAVVSITNLTGFDFVEVWYVGEEGTLFSNVDGLVGPFPGLAIDQRDAFRIDAVGVNTPLIFESITPDGIFEVGETWGFIIQDYMHSGGGPPDLFNSIGIAAASDGFPPSTGSIIAFVPEPSSAALLGIGALSILLRRRR